MTNPVLIVGAGPVGLTAAVALRQRDVPVRIVDKAPARTDQSRAAIIHARTIEVLERLGLSETFVQAGVPVHGGVVYAANARELIRFKLDALPTAYPFFLGLTQSETERLLTEELSRLEVEIERSVEMTSLSQDDRCVTAVLKKEDGTEERVSSPYLLGCDGGRSTTRRLVGLKMEGETLDSTWLTADVRIDWKESGAFAIAFATPEGFAFVARMDHDRWRIVANLPDVKLERPEDANLALIQEVFDRRFKMKARIYDPVWISPFAVNTRMTRSMQAGRVFLAGDAAHVHSPVGGQGMNTGIQDAFNLGWKLALSLQGKAGPELLSSYDAERHANSKRLLAFVGPATKMVNLHHPLVVAFRNGMLRFLGRLGVGGAVARRMSQLEVHYRDSPAVSERSPGVFGWLLAALRGAPRPDLWAAMRFAKGPKAGDRAPDAAGVIENDEDPVRLFELWARDLRFQLLLFTGPCPSPSEATSLANLAAKAEAAAPELLKARLVRTLVAEVREASVDSQGDAHRAYAALRPCLYLVRPDGYIAYRSIPDEGALADEWKPLQAFLHRMIAVQSPAAR